MHELAITQNMLDIALEQAEKHNACKITKINLVVGEMSGVVDECVLFYFDFLSKDTIASDATLSFERIPIKAHCYDCDITFPLSEFNWVCPNCQGSNIKVVAGRELYIDSMEME
jgi:hydrogenase nickel incorporation protein HypA/HybF